MMPKHRKFLRVGLLVVLVLLIGGLWLLGDALPRASAPEMEGDALLAPDGLSPGVDSLDGLLAQQEPLPEPSASGMGLAWVVFVGMFAALGLAGWWLVGSGGGWQRPLPTKVPSLENSHWLVPLLALSGLGVAIYLAYVETNEVAAFCGPVGNCNAVQSSQYAIFLGVPVAIWGMVNYVGVAGLWAAGVWGNGRAAVLARLALAGLTFVGVLFSIYLTALELFVIEAVCIWCISSAIIATALHLLAVRMVVERPQAAARLGTAVSR